MAETEKEKSKIEQQSEFKDEKKKQKIRGPNFFLICLLIFNLLLAVSAIGVVVYVYFFTEKIKIEEKNEITKITEKDKEMALGPMYTLEEFKVNLAGSEGKIMLKTVVELEFFDEESLTEAEIITSRIRNIIINILSSKNKSEILNIRGKLYLRDQIIRSINAVMTKGSVKYVYFSKFVIE